MQMTCQGSFAITVHRDRGVVVMDNASFHKRQDMKKAIKDAGHPDALHVSGSAGGRQANHTGELKYTSKLPRV